MHAMYYRRIEEVVEIEKTCQRLDKAVLKDGTEAMIMTAHMPNKTPGAGYAKMPVAHGTIQHITAGFKDTSSHGVHGATRPSGWHSVQEHLC